MSITAQSVIRRVVDTVQDLTSIRWTLRELVRYLNDGQREIIVYRPDAIRTSADVTLVAGVRQSLPALGTKLIDIPRNTSGAAITKVARNILDSVPSWTTLTSVTVIKHYCYDERDPTAFLVYPPAASSGASLQVIYSALPTDIAQPAEGAAITPSMTESDTTQVAGTISVPDIYANALNDYILYRSFLKDSEFAGNSARAVSHYAAFANALGIEIKATMAIAPVTAGAKVAA